MPLPSMQLPKWYRALAIVVGVVSIALALIVLIEPLLALWLLILLLAFALLVMGLDRLIAGITGHPFSSFAPVVAAEFATGSMGPPSQPPSGSSPPSRP